MISIRKTNAEGSTQSPVHGAIRGLTTMAAMALLGGGVLTANTSVVQASTGYGPYTTLASPTLNERSAPSTSASIIGSLPYHSSVMIACQTTGSSVNGSGIWDQLVSGAYVSDYWVNTPNVGIFSPPIPQCSPGPPPSPSSISTNGTLSANQTLTSPNGAYHLCMQGDGNLVEYNAAGRPLWDTQTNGNPGAHAVLQSDGNFVVYSASGRALWASYTSSGGSESLQMQGDGNVVIYASSGTPLWANYAAVAPTGQTIGSNWFPGGQCTWWAEQEAASYMGAYPDFNGNARDWASWAGSHGYAVGSGPRVGSVVVFQPGYGGAGSVGHVAWVTEVYPNTGTITISEMNFAGFNRVDTRNVGGAFNNPGISYIYLNP